jgi:hypothetical protein
MREIMKAIVEAALKNPDKTGATVGLIVSTALKFVIKAQMQDDRPERRQYP